MQVREKTGQTLTEPITVAEFKTFSGYTGSDQDTLIDTFITAARKLFENETGLSVISKVYEVEFDRWDMISDDLTKVGYSGWDDGWYRLPFSPVTAIASVDISDVATTYSRRGLKTVEIRPNAVIQTGITNNTLAVEFTAGAASDEAKIAILRIVTDFFNNREDGGGASVGSLSFDTKRIMSNLSINTGF